MADQETILQYIAEQKKRLRKAQIGKNTAEKADAYYNLGSAYYLLEDFHRAIEYLKQYLSIAEEVGERAGAGYAYGNLGCIYGSLGEPQTALEYHKKSLSIAKEVGNRAGEGCGYGNLGKTYESLGEFQRAIEYHNQHLSIAKEVGNRACQGKAYANLSFAYFRLDKFQRAIEYSNKFLIIDEEVGDRAEQEKVYIILSDIYSFLGEYQRAREYINKCLIIAQEDGNRATEGIAYGNLGIFYYALEDFQRAMECTKKHLSIAKEVGDRVGKGLAYGNIGAVRSSLKDFPQAIECYKQQLSIGKEVGDRELEQRAYCGFAGCYEELHDFKEAIGYYKQHLSLAEEMGEKGKEACGHHGLGRSFLYLGFLNQALEHFRCSVKIYDTLRASSISDDELKISFRTQHEFAYTNLWQVLVMLERNDEALYAAERGRAQALLDALKVTYDLTSLSPRSIESEEEVRYISRKTTVLTVFLALHLNTVNIWVLGKEGNPIFRQNEIEIGREHKHALTLLVDTVLKNIRAGVGIRCENRSMDKLSDDSTPSSTRDDNQTSEPSQESTDYFQPLYDAVLGPIEDLLHGDELIVVPDGALCVAPWAALRESLRIRMVPSLTSLEVITDSPCEYHSKSGALLVGDPCLEKVTNKWGNPIYKQLKYAKMEVEMIGEILKSQPLTGEDATKEAVLQRIKSVSLVHIAAHGRPETGEIFLAPVPRWESHTPTEEDCIMKMSHIQAVKLRARLVVLSCCHSGQGQVSSEGVVGMARAFLFAGARSVLASLWAIDDEATMMFMKSIYQQLGSGESASVALQRAMKCLRDSHDFSAPKYWAPFVLMGDDVKIELEKGH